MMQTITLKIDDSVMEKFVWLLNHFDKKEVEIVEKKKTKNEIIDGLKEAVEDVKKGKIEQVENLWKDMND
jgi:predicted DNA-binding protein YlxM (UPF0122 family)